MLSPLPQSSSSVSLLDYLIFIVITPILGVPGFPVENLPGQTSLLSSQFQCNFLLDGVNKF